MSTETPDYTPALEALTDRERVLIEGRLRGMTIAQAAIAAGMTLSYAQTTLNEPHGKAALKQGRAISAAAMHMTRERLTGMLLEAYRAAGCAAEMVMACRELAKLHGLNAPQQVQIDHSHRVAMVKSEELKALPLHELERLARSHGEDVLEGEFSTLPSAAGAVRTLEHGEVD